jgi:hypothetical protein
MSPSAWIMSVMASSLSRPWGLARARPVAELARAAARFALISAIQPLTVTGSAPASSAAR